MSSPYTPFSTILNNFTSDVSNFAESAANGSLPSIPIATVTPSNSTSQPSSLTQKVTNAVTNSVMSSLFSSRVVAVLTGLLCLSGAFFLFGIDEVFGGSTTGRAIRAGAKIALF